MLLTGCYAAVVLSVLCLEGKGNYFCNRPGSSGFLIPTLALTFVVVIWDLISSSLAGVVARFVGTKSAPFLAAVFVFAGLTTLPFIVFRGGGSTAFENTWADVSCFVTEGYGMMFPVTMAPLFAVATLIKEWLILRSQKRRAAKV